MPSRDISRRDLLQASASLAATALPTLAAFSAFAGRPARAAGGIDHGPLLPATDDATGYELVRLPRGFRYLTYNWHGDPLADGTKTPNRHDGMGVVHQEGDVVTLVRNHENPNPRQTPFTPPHRIYDETAGGGTVNLKFDVRQGKWLEAWPTLSGTCSNCSGGPTPWNTWLSCEETHAGPGGDPRKGFPQQHGWIFEVPWHGVAEPVPIHDAGVFDHEAVAVDPATGYVYETQDMQEMSGFYRYVPDHPARLSAGGRLYMLRVPDRQDLTGGLTSPVPFQTPMPVEWVQIDDPRRAHTREGDGRGVFDQGYRKGGSNFRRLEGCWYEGGRIVFTSTTGGIAGTGQIWLYDPSAETLMLIYESPGRETLDHPDNITVHPGGRFLVVCEDGDASGPNGGQRLHLLTLDGRIAPFCENVIRLDGGPLARGHKGDFRKGEWAGVSFSPDGKWLFANNYRPGITFAITGPWL